MSNYWMLLEDYSRGLINSSILNETRVLYGLMKRKIIFGLLFYHHVLIVNLLSSLNRDLLNYQSVFLLTLAGASTNDGCHLCKNTWEQREQYMSLNQMINKAPTNQPEAHTIHYPHKITKHEGQFDNCTWIKTEKKCKWF